MILRHSPGLLLWAELWFCRWSSTCSLVETLAWKPRTSGLSHFYFGKLNRVQPPRFVLLLEAPSTCRNEHNTTCERNTTLILATEAQSQVESSVLIEEDSKRRQSGPTAGWVYTQLEWVFLSITANKITAVLDLLPEPFHLCASPNSSLCPFRGSCIRVSSCFYSLKFVSGMIHFIFPKERNKKYEWETLTW